MSSTFGAHAQLMVGSVVKIAPEVAGVQAPTGSLVARDRLGPGVVQEVSTEGAVRVHWPSADLDTWVTPEDLEPAEPRARLVEIYRSRRDGRRTLEKCKVVAKAGLDYNWIVDICPGNVIRTVRSDGSAWTFDWYPIRRCAQPRGTNIEYALPEDDDAEALTVAELWYH
jgi:hypothetical protein